MTSGTTTGTHDSTWDAWTQVYSIQQRYVNSNATTANVYALQAELNQLLNTWTAWNVTYTTGSATTLINQANVWDGWNGTYTVQAREREAQIVRDIRAGKRPSAEQQEKWRQEELARKAAEEKRLKEIADAKVKADVLLKSCLSPQQREELEQRGCFHLLVGEKKYRIEKGSHGNVKLIDKDGRVKRSFCVQPRGVPDGDTMLAQKLLLETDERQFYKLANVSEHDANGAAFRTLHAPRGVELLRDTAQGTG